MRNKEKFLEMRQEEMEWDNNTETHEIWTNQLSNENYQIVVASDGEIVTRHIFNQQTNKQGKTHF